MPDKIQITITRGCDANGVGGVVADAPTVVLDTLPDGTPLLDVILLAFADSYPIAMIPGATPADPQIPSMTTIRNLSYQLRMFTNNVVGGWRANKKREAAAALTAVEDVGITQIYRVI